METLEQLVEILKSGATAWNAFIYAKRAINTYYYADLRGADLSGADLSRANLSRAYLRRAYLRGADLSGADLSRAYLRGADLRGANLSDADLSDANLSDANLSDADLRRANLSDADLSDANLSGADLSGADLSDADLSDAEADFIMKCLKLPQEIKGLREALVSGKIDGSCYEGDCCCFVGTMEKLAASEQILCPIPRIADSPIERLFTAIKAGDTPRTNQVSAIIVGWIDELLDTFNKIKAM